MHVDILQTDNFKNSWKLKSVASDKIDSVVYITDPKDHIDFEIKNIQKVLGSS